MTTTYKVTALEDVKYRLMSSYPPDGFSIHEGNFILITKEMLPFLRVRKANGKGKGKFKSEEWATR